MTTETYEPAEKPCPICGETFTGMADVPTELCDDCVNRHTSIYLAGFQDGQANPQEG